jgi:hypothetical protein
VQEGPSGQVLLPEVQQALALLAGLLLVLQPLVLVLVLAFAQLLFAQRLLAQLA